jgi:tetratricopeptide (TPR) repeat protein
MARASLQHPESLDAYGLIWRGYEAWLRWTPKDNARARELFEKAVTLYPNYGGTYALLAWTHFVDWRSAWVPASNRKQSCEKALDLAHKALALDPSNSWGHMLLGSSLMLYRNKPQEAIAQFEEGLKANPNSADLLAMTAEPYVYIGQPEEAIKRVKEAMRLNPYYPNWYLWTLGTAQYVAHDYEGGVETFRKMSPMGEARRTLAACLAYLGRMEEARAEAEKFLKDNPTFSASKWAISHPFLHDKDRQHAVEGFVKAGLPR